MDAFKTHEQVISNYRSYLSSFLNIADDRIKDEVKRAFDSDGFIPEPLIQFNPSFEKGSHFVYNTLNGPVLIFCDGSVHDKESVKKDDLHKRTLLRDKGYDVIEWYYKETVEDLAVRRKDIFRKIN